jgi:hypothetical protein
LAASFIDRLAFEIAEDYYRPESFWQSAYFLVQNGP